MKILVVGAGGYIGIPLCEELAGRGHDVVALDRWFFGKFPNVGRIIKRDIRSSEMFELGDVDVVIDLSGLSNDASADIDPLLTTEINLKGACKLADRAKRAGVKKYIYSSSCSVYGHGDKQGLTEEDECKPLTLYAECKVRVEDHLRSISDSAFKPVILRNATVFGVAPRMRFDLAVNVMTLRAWRDGRILVMGGGDQWRPFVHVRDVVSAFVHYVETDDIPDPTINIGISSLNMSIGQLANKVKAAIPSARIENIPDQSDARSYNVNFDRFERFYRSWDAVSVDRGVSEVMTALASGQISGDDPTCYTLQYYKSLMDWENRLNAIRLDGRIL